MSETSRLAVLVACALGLAALSPLVQGQTPMRVLGGFSNQLQNTAVEKPFFEGLEQSSGGKYKVQFRFIDEVGLKGFDAMRQLQSGLFQVMAVSPGYVAGDDAFILGLDLPGITPELATARKAVDAYRGALDERLQARYGGKLLALWPYPGQVFFCKGTTSGLDGLKGKKVRVFSPALAALVEHFGGAPVTLPFSDVYQGLQRGVVDCAITASLSGNSAKWFEVTDHLYPLAVSWAIQSHVANADFWKGLAPAERDALAGRFKAMEERMWSMAESATQDGINCNTGTGKCERGTPAKMRLVPVTDADRKRVREAADKVVLGKWTADCRRTYPDCARVWNGSIGKVVGLEAK